MGKNVTRSRDEAQVREHLFCKQPAPNAVIYRTGRLLKTPQLLAVINPLPRVQFRHQSRWLDGIPDALPAGETSPGILHWSPNTPVGSEIPYRIVNVGTELGTREDTNSEASFIT